MVSPGTDVAVPSQNGAAAAPSQSALSLWVQDARAVQQVAEHIASSTFVPQALRGKPVEVMVAMLAGQELGMQPMATLRSIDVIQGTPSLRAHAMRGLVLSHGHDLEVVESDAEHCVMRGRRKGSPTWQTVQWDIARAKALGLLDKDQWRRQPQTMLIARATGELCRLIAADVLYAMPYASEERDDEPIRAQATVTTEKLLAPLDDARPATMFQPINIEAEDRDEPPFEVEQKITGPQSKKLHALFREAGVDDRDARLRWVSEVLGREVTSSSDLTRVEAGQVIDAVEAYIASQEPPEGGEPS